MQESVKIDRHKYLGGSDIPVIMGISPYKKRFDLLLEKAQLKEDDFQGNAYTRYGEVMESKIRDYINYLFEKHLVEGKYIEEGDPIGVRCHTDGEDDTTILEVKTTGSDGIHDDLDDYGIYLVQELYYMAKEKKENGILAVYERPEDMSTDFDPERLHVYCFVIDEYEGLVDQINFAVERFKVDLIRMQENPLISEEEIIGIPSEVLEVSNKLVALEAQINEMKATEKKVKEMKDNLKALMLHYGIKSWVTPNNYRITLVEDAPDTEKEEEYFDMEYIKKKAPKTYEKSIKTKTVTVKGKSGYVKITAPKG